MTLQVVGYSLYFKSKLRYNSFYEIYIVFIRLKLSDA